MSDNLSIEISKELVNPIIESKIKGAILQALGGSDSIIQGVVNEVFNRKVDAKGHTSNYSSDNKYRWIDVVISNKLEEYIKIGVQQWAEGNKDVIAKEVERQLSTKGTKSALVKSFMESIISTTTHGFKMKVDISEYGRGHD